MRDHVLVDIADDASRRHRETLVRDWERRFDNDAQAVEAMMNHVHRTHVHMGEPRPPEDQLRYLGRVLRDVYAIKLRADCPERIFEVRFNEGPGQGLDAYQLTFWQVRGAPEAETPHSTAPA